MPKVTWNIPKPKHIPAEPVLALLELHQRVLGYTSDILAYKLGMEGSSVRRKKLKGEDMFRLKDLKAWGIALEIPPEDMAKAVEEYLRK